MQERSYFLASQVEYVQAKLGWHSQVIANDSGVVEGVGEVLLQGKMAETGADIE